MLTKYTKLIIGVFLLLWILGCGGMKMITTTPDNNSGQLPRRKVVITIDTSQQDKLFAQFRKFADKQGFTILIDTRPPGVEGFYVDMYRRDIEINGTNPFAPEEYKLGIYDTDRQNPASDSVVDALVSDLQNFVSEVPGATFSVEK